MLFVYMISDDITSKNVLHNLYGYVTDVITCIVTNSLVVYLHDVE